MPGPTTVHHPSSVLQLLEDAAPSRGAQGMRLVRALRAGYPDLMLDGVSHLVAGAGVTPQALDDLAAAAGLRDFAEAQHLARAEIDRGLRNPGARYTARLAGRARHRPPPSELLERIAEQDCANITATVRTLAGNGALELAAQAVVAARRRYVVADRKSYAYAHLLGTDLQSFLRDVVLVDGLVNRPPDVLPDVTSADVAVCFSFRRYSKSALATAHQMRLAGATLVGVTDDSQSELAVLTAIALVVETTSQSLVDSPAAVASTVHALATLAALRARSARSRLAARDELARELGIYEEKPPGGAAGAARPAGAARKRR